MFVINDTANTKTSDVLSMAENFYSNAKTPDEQLSNLVGNVVGGAVAGKVANSISSKSNIQEIPQLKDLKPKNIIERFNAKFTGSQKGYEVSGDYNKALEDFYSLNPKEVKATDKGFTGKIITADGREINITVRNNSSQKSGGVPTIDLKDPKLKNSSKIRYIGK